ncbi:DUF3618 domain-containing protein [Methylobacterium soli]|uniref:DUF3618 domain-containing protein n=1 Tax=Methylobacterium soli TaxID=553447 RepID=A0A6L3SU71_9HYPH|nr:DUF3618 domain-containing protein [Methylobacterium soli]KAB1076763.1 DUF3618 domain-containing protein [Methylobacterium soli]GJE42796.1 hypothetical protein AEGHOMDF_1969 [Methylobacterium soli]
MTKSADDLEHEVEASRSKLDRTLDSLQSRLNFSGATANLMNPEWRARTLHGNTDRFVGAARTNPLPVLLILGGLGFLVYDAVSRAAEARRLAMRPAAPPRPNTDRHLDENRQDRLHDKLDAALEESFPGSDPVSVRITK